MVSHFEYRVSGSLTGLDLQTYGPYSSDTQNDPSSFTYSPSQSTATRRPPGPSPPKPSPVYVAAGRSGNPAYDRCPVASASSPVQGVPSGPENPTESSYRSCRLGPEGCSTLAPGAGVNKTLNLWTRGWKFSVPSVFLGEAKRSASVPTPDRSF